MRSKLQKFTQFTNTLLPHETAYLLSVEQFKDEVRLEILERVDYNAQHIRQFTPYDVALDKRKYNHLQNWIQTRLQAIDVDEHFNWMLEMERKIMTDSIELEEEKTLLKAVKNYEHPIFFFRKFHELIRAYRRFLLIRLRYDEYETVNVFLERYKEDYDRAVDINRQIQQATQDVVSQYAGEGGESKHWEEWLGKIFYDESLEGLLRYLALVRLTFISYNYRKFDDLREQFDYLDQQFLKGKYYSKRLLLNYYNNRLMLHSHYKEYDKAVYYGYLSIRSINHDYPLYVNNLCAVLLRLNRKQEALQLMKEAAPEVKKTSNFHNRIGFVAFYMEALCKNSMYRNAESYGDTFLKAYAKEVIQYRWHLFFTIYLEAILYQDNNAKILRVAKKYHLQTLDKQYKENTANYQPSIPLYIALAQYREGLIDRQELYEKLDGFADLNAPKQKQTKDFIALLNSIKQIVPELSTFLARRGV
jgi:hypothetical protein